MEFLTPTLEIGDITKRVNRLKELINIKQPEERNNPHAQHKEKISRKLMQETEVQYEQGY
jgi:hypothetical protein